MFTIRRTLATLLIVLCTLSPALAQDSKSVAPPSTSLTITAAAAGERVRFTAPAAVVRMHVEIYSEAGETLFDGSSKGNVFDWTLAASGGQRVTDGSYLCVLTAKTLSGKIGQRLGIVSVQDKQVSVRGAQASQLSTAQQQAVGPVEENASLTVLTEAETPSATVIAHDGRNGQVTSTTGALTFRTGDVFGGQEVEQMRLTEEGNLGIGTEQPEARLDVNGMIRARQGFQFADGSVLNLAPKGGLSITLPGGRTAAVNLAPSAIAATANKLPKFADAGGALADSVIYQDPNNGYIGIGTTTPAHPFVVRRNGGTLGVHSLGELFVDRDDRTRSASLTVGTAGTLKWIFGMPYQSDGFQVYDLTNNVSRFFVDPTSGGIGMGTTTPRAGIRLEVNGNTLITPGNGYEIQFGAPNAETGMTLIKPANSRADLRFDGSTLKLLATTGVGVPAVTNGVVINTAGTVGIGTGTPTSGKLHVVGGAGQPAIYGESGNRGVWGKSTGSSYGVYGESVSGIGIQGVSNTNIGVSGSSTSTYGVYGASTGIGSVGVFGEANVAGAAGVFGLTSSPVGYALYARNTGGGYGLFSENNVGQNRDKGGFVKAMVYLDPSQPSGHEIVRCYNSFLSGSAATTGNCGFGYNGNSAIDFGFQVNDRFVSLTPVYSSGQVLASVCTFPAQTQNQVAFCTSSVGGIPVYIPIYIIVY